MGLVPCVARIKFRLILAHGIASFASLHSGAAGSPPKLKETRYRQGECYYSILYSFYTCLADTLGLFRPSPPPGWNPKYPWESDTPQAQDKAQNKAGAQANQPMQHAFRERHGQDQFQGPRFAPTCYDPSSRPTTRLAATRATDTTKVQERGRAPFKDMMRSARKLSCSLFSTTRRSLSRLRLEESESDKAQNEMRRSKSPEMGHVSVKGGETNDSRSAGLHKSRSATSRRSSPPEHRERKERGRRVRRRNTSRHRPLSLGERLQGMVTDSKLAQGVAEPKAQRKRSRSHCSIHSHTYASARSRSPQAHRQTKSSPARDTRRSRTDIGRSRIRQGEGEEARDSSDMSDLEGNRQITRMDGLLDIWDAIGDKNWETQAFNLCGLSRCDRCRKFYAPLRFMPHACRLQGAHEHA